MISAEIARLMETDSGIRRMWMAGFELKQQYGEENVADMTFGNPVAQPPELLRQTLQEIAEAIGRGPPTPRSLFPELPRTWEAAIHAALQAEPDQRPVSAEALAAIWETTDRGSGCQRLNRSPEPAREPGGSGCRLGGAGSTTRRSRFPLGSRRPRSLMASQQAAIRPMTSGSRWLYSRVTISNCGVLFSQPGKVATRSRARPEKGGVFREGHS